MAITQTFSTLIYEAPLLPNKSRLSILNQNLIREVLDLSHTDKAGVTWSKKNYPHGYTSYASANNMHLNSPTFDELERYIRPHLATFLRRLQLDVQPKHLSMSTCWANIMHARASHSMHIHPLSVISGTYYVTSPKNSSCIRFEDPRYTAFMSRPPLKKNAAREQQMQFSLPIKAGHLVLFESWLKHEVPANTSKSPRMSVSFNYDWR